MEEQFKFNEQLFLALKRARLTNRMLAKGSGIQENLISLTANGQYIPTRKQQFKILTFLKKHQKSGVKELGDIFEI